jgi:hypothetical protein
VLSVGPRLRVEFVPEPKPTQPPLPSFLAALSRVADDFCKKVDRARVAVGKWLEEHEEGIALTFVALQVVGDVLPKVKRLMDEHDEGSYQHLLAEVELSDALGVLLCLARGDEAVEEHLEAALTNPVFVDELICAVEAAPLNPPLIRQLTHGLELLKDHDYVVAVPALIQGLEGAFWHVPEERGLIMRQREKMRVVGGDGQPGKTLGGVAGALDLLDEVDPPFRVFLARLVFGGRGNRFRHGNATEGWRLEALLLVVALVGWLERFAGPGHDGYLRRAFAGRTESQLLAYSTFPALKALADMRPNYVEFAIDMVMLFAQTSPLELEEMDESEELIIDENAKVAEALSV